MFSNKEFIEAFETTLKNMFNIIQAKNHDYGGATDPFNNFRMVEKLNITDLETGILVRMSDKMARISTLLKSPAKVVDEKLEDTLLDLANYAIILKLYLQQKKQAYTMGATEISYRLYEVGNTEAGKIIPTSL